MKKTISLIAAIAMAASLTLGLQAARAQMVSQGDVSLGIQLGYFTAYSFDNGYANSGAPIGISISYAASEKVVIGAEVGFLTLSTNRVDIAPTYYYDQFGNLYSGNDGYAYHYDINATYYLANLQINWSNRDRIAIYSGIGLGSVGGNVELVYDKVPYSSYFYGSESADFGGLTYQLTAIGYKAKLGDHFGVHLDLGYGIKGVLYGGIDYRF